MDFDLQSEDLAVRDVVRSFAAEHLRPGAQRADEERWFDGSRVRLLGEAGILGGPVPVSFGGTGWTLVQWALAMEELGAVDSSWRGFCTVQSALCAGILYRSGSTDQQALVRDLCSGKAIFAFALTEPEAGTDAASLRTRATPTDSGFVLTGEKHWITNGGVADWIIVFANADPDRGKDGITGFLVPGDAPGLERLPMEGHELGHRGSNHARLRFHGVRVPESGIIGSLGGGYALAMGGLGDGRLGVAAGAVGIQRGCFDLCLELVRHRRQFGRRLGDFQLVQSDLAHMYADLQATRWMTLHAAWLRDQGRGNAREVALAKWTACDAAVRTADRAVLLHGARGYASDCPVGRHLRDAKGLQIYEGTSHIQQVILARDLLGKESR